jgi:2-polyprenyl-3-methyl-5-hydroxy-6-metoxy-1,4-benzoquinol methylase
MPTKESIQQAVEIMRKEYGDWTYDIPLPFGLWTRGGLNVPHTRLKRLVQTVSDLSRKPLTESRVLDLACLDGLFSIEFAKQGAETVGIEIRDANVKKALFCKEALGLPNLTFAQDDVRNISVERYGRFDAIVCSGILYHLTAEDAFDVIKRMASMVNRVVVIDTHVALQAQASVTLDGQTYCGSIFREHADNATPQQKAGNLWASADNTTSFWFTRPSLINLLNAAGFSSVYECFTPAHLNFGRPGLESRDRCTIVAIKDEACQLITSPAANSINERWPEQTLAY